MPRTISIGLLKPSKLEKDIIYVSLDLQRGGIRAEVVSHEDFEYDTHAIAGNPLHLSGKETSNLDGGISTRWYKPYKELLDNLIRNNDGVLDYNRLVEESTSLHSKCKDIAKIISKQQ